MNTFYSINRKTTKDKIKKELGLTCLVREYKEGSAQIILHPKDRDAEKKNLARLMEFFKKNDIVYFWGPVGAKTPFHVNGGEFNNLWHINYYMYKP